MKKITFTFLLSAISLIVFAQIKPGMELGFQMTNSINTNSSLGSTEKLNGNIKPAFRGGIIVDFLIVNNFSIQPGLLYSMYNLQSSTPVSLFTAGTYDVKSKVIAHTLQLPLYFLYKTSVEGRGRFFVGAGPYASYTLGARRYLSTPTLIADSTQPGFYRVDEIKSKYNMKINNKAGVGNYNPFEFGLGACVGYELPVGVFFRGQFQHGLTNTIPGGNDNYSSINWSFGVSVGIYFGDGGGGYNW